MARFALLFSFLILNIGLVVLEIVAPTTLPQPDFVAVFLDAWNHVSLIVILCSAVREGNSVARIVVSTDLVGLYSTMNLTFVIITLLPSIPLP
jgi:hypothetical protein